MSDAPHDPSSGDWPLLLFLQDEGLDYTVTPLGYADGIRVLVHAGSEIWMLDIGGDGHVEGLAYRTDPAEAFDEAGVRARLTDRIGRAWRQAAEDLGVAFVSPYAIPVESGASIRVTGWLPHFGSAKGTIIMGGAETQADMERADALGYNVPGLNPLWYDAYDRERFVATLEAWGWIGDPDQRPAWLK